MKDNGWPDWIDEEVEKKKHPRVWRINPQKKEPKVDPRPNIIFWSEDGWTYMSFDRPVTDLVIRYTTNGKYPLAYNKIFKEQIQLPKGTRIKALGYTFDNKVATKMFEYKTK